MLVGYRTSVDCQGKFFALAGEITRIIVEAIKVRENIALNSREIFREMSRDIPEFGPNFFTNFGVKEWENKERNSRILFALILQVFDKDEMINMTASVGQMKDPSPRRETNPRSPEHRRALYSLSYENILRARPFNWVHITRVLQTARINNVVVDKW